MADIRDDELMSAAQRQGQHAYEHMHRLIQFENWAEADTEASCLAWQRVHLTEQ